ncbi:Nramp family divalent metal transporter [Calycomorphotria hydatis]|uniref:Manganese transport protein MntH n=1 Tax=Calycomorphotria hydatis TaxID=2528027 RepID=A0A517TB66_9PLAN|nr:Nramp family divalent metal transporter [Calycomorphotria hydatis]QDT65610.1 manganese transport protein MntH [Calycomorphotria hydatis]
MSDPHESPLEEEVAKSDESGVMPAPTTFWPILMSMGPGVIIAGGIVGSGELIATTKTGAEAGYSLLWLIIIGCVVKVFAQVEFGRFSINTGRTALEGMNELPGPRFKTNWLLWYATITVLFIVSQQGGIVGAAGQSLALTVPITGDFTAWVDASRASELVEYETTYDDAIWSCGLTLLTVVLLSSGRYSLVQNISLVFVLSFTVVTIGNLIALQSIPDWAMSWENLAYGLSFQLPEPSEDLTRAPVTTAMATFGIIGLGAFELIFYPYWCLEKGYARHVGKPDTPGWAERARGWLRIMQYDAWGAMALYTTSTVAFYILGASVLHRQGLNPDSSQLVPVLTEMYRPVFGEAAGVIFLSGAFAVLYSTFFSACASLARLCADLMKFYDLRPDTEESYHRWVGRFGIIIPLVGFVMYYTIRLPGQMILAAGLMQSVMLPMLGAAALYFRYYRCHSGITPSKAWDVFLWLSCISLLIAGIVTAYLKLMPYFN